MGQNWPPIGWRGTDCPQSDVIKDVVTWLKEELAWQRGPAPRLRRAKPRRDNIQNAWVLVEYFIREKKRPRPDSLEKPTEEDDPVWFLEEVLRYFSATRPAKRKIGRQKGDIQRDYENDSKLVEDWQAAKSQGSTRREFCRAKGIEISDLENAQRSISRNR